MDDTVDAPQGVKAQDVTSQIEEKKKRELLS